MLPEANGGVYKVKNQFQSLISRSINVTTLSLGFYEKVHEFQSLISRSINVTIT